MRQRRPSNPSRKVVRPSRFVNEALRNVESRSKILPVKARGITAPDLFSPLTCPPAEGSPPHFHKLFCISLPYPNAGDKAERSGFTAFGFETPIPRFPDNNLGRVNSLCLQLPGPTERPQERTGHVFLWGPIDGRTPPP